MDRTDTFKERENDQMSETTHWNYRLLYDSTGLANLRVVEVYYDKDDAIVGWCEASPPQGDTVEDLLSEMETMTAATVRPVLTMEDLSGGEVTAEDITS